MRGKVERVMKYQYAALTNIGRRDVNEDALNVRTGAVVGTDSNIYLSVQPTQAEKEALYMKSEERTIAIALKACVLLAK